MMVIVVVVALAVRDGNGRLPAAGPLDHTRRMTSLSGVTRIPGFGRRRRRAIATQRSSHLRAINRHWNLRRS